MYFLAVLAPPEVNEKVLQWKHYMRDHFGCVVALRSPAHITLMPPFWMDEKLETELTIDISSFASRNLPFEIELENFDAFKPRVIFLHVNETRELNELKTELEGFLLSKEKYPIKKESRTFHPHVTIANRDLLKKDFSEAFNHFQRIEYKRAFAVDEIAIMKHLDGEWKAIQRLGLNGPLENNC